MVTETPTNSRLLTKATSYKVGAPVQSLPYALQSVESIEANIIIGIGRDADEASEKSVVTVFSDLTTPLDSASIDGVGTSNSFDGYAVSNDYMIGVLGCSFQGEYRLSSVVKTVGEDGTKQTVLATSTVPFTKVQLTYLTASTFVLMAHSASSRTLQLWLLEVNKGNAVVATAISTISKGKTTPPLIFPLLTSS